MNPRAHKAAPINLPIRPWISVRFSPPVLARPLPAVEGSLPEAHSPGMRGAPVQSGTLPPSRPTGCLLHRPTAGAAVRFLPIQPSQQQPLKQTNP